jgi:hypothetical protein
MVSRLLRSSGWFSSPKPPLVACLSSLCHARELAVGPCLQPFEDFYVGSLGLPVAVWMCHLSEGKLDAYVLAVIPKEVARELGPVVGDEPIWKPEPGHQVHET